VIVGVAGITCPAPAEKPYFYSTADPEQTAPFIRTPQRFYNGSTHQEWKAARLFPSQRLIPAPVVLVFPVSMPSPLRKRKGTALAAEGEKETLVRTG